MKGYNFKSLLEITPFLEQPESGISYLWARTAALKYDCTVAVGYPELVGSGQVDLERDGLEQDAIGQGQQAGSGPYNSVVVVNRDGEIVANYRKSFLYYTDETWAREGSGFYQGEMKDLGQVAMGICKLSETFRKQTPSPLTRIKGMDIKYALILRQPSQN